MSNVYLVTVATANNAHIRFSYWAEAKLSFGSLIAIIVCGIVFMTLLVLGALFFFIDRTIKKTLDPTIKEVKSIFTNTIEKMEPGTLSSRP